MHAATIRVDRVTLRLLLDYCACMLGFAVIDAQGGDPDSQIAVWLTSRTGPTAVEHTNAVRLSRDDDAPRLGALVADRIILLTPGSSLASLLDLPENMPIMSVPDLDTLADATSQRHAEVVDATRAYMSRTRNRALVLPDSPPARPRLTPDALPSEGTTTSRALAVADYLRCLWRDWLEVEEQRRRRSIAPRTGESPWIMPEDLSGTTIADLPTEFAGRFAPTHYGRVTEE